MPSSLPRRNRRWFGCGAVDPLAAKSSRGGAVNSTTASVAVTGRDLPARISHGTPAHLHDSIWNRNFIASVQITMSEDFGVQGRGKFYDEVGALRDVVQNHLLEIVALLAMEPPSAATAAALHDEKVKVFRQIETLDPASSTETYVAMQLEID